MPYSPGDVLTTQHQTGVLGTKVDLVVVVMSAPATAKYVCRTTLGLDLVLDEVELTPIQAGISLDAASQNLKTTGDNIKADATAQDLQRDNPAPPVA
jgi:hypothetical protein